MKINNLSKRQAILQKNEVYSEDILLILSEN